MTLKEQLFEDLKSAMKEKDTIRKDTVQLIRSGILQIEKDNKVELDENETRVYVTVQNDGTDVFHLYPFNAKISQDGKQSS